MSRLFFYSTISHFSVWFQTNRCSTNLFILWPSQKTDGRRGSNKCFFSSRKKKYSIPHIVQILSKDCIFKPYSMEYHFLFRQNSLRNICSWKMSRKKEDFNLMITERNGQTDKYSEGLSQKCTHKMIYG